MIRIQTALLDLRLRRRSTIGYTVGLGLYVFAIVALYPSFKGDSSLDDFTKGNSTVAALFGATGSLTSPVGWLNANVYANFLPLVVLLGTIGYGAMCVGGQDEDGTLGLVVTLPRTRRSIVWQKAATLVLVTLPATVATLVIGLLGRGFELTVGPGHLAGCTLAVLLLGIDLGALAMLVGAATGSRGTALGISSAVAAAMYLVSSLAPVTDWMHPLRFGSLFYWAVGDDQLARGVSVLDIAVLLVVAALLFTATARAFDRLDVH